MNSSAALPMVKSRCVSFLMDASKVASRMPLLLSMLVLLLVDLLLVFFELAPLKGQSLLSNPISQNQWAAVNWNSLHFWRQDNVLEEANKNAAIRRHTIIGLL